VHNKLLARFAHNKYRLTIFGLLSGASVLSVAVLRVRFAFAGTGSYAFLIWNLFLAWIPFLIAYFTYTLTLKRPWVYLIVPLAAFLWLIFFPNTLYILTDFQHLNSMPNDVPVWYDVLLLIWFAWTGLLLGIVSLFLMQEIVRREFGRWFGWGFVALVAGLTSVGIYMGRFLRWNSWDILQRPGDIVLFTWSRAQDPSMTSVAFISLFSVFFLFLYVTLYAFAHLLLERDANQKREAH
jgi:uncharacterized membrane protein